MNQLRESLVLTDARAISLTRQLTKDGSTYVLVVKGPLDVKLADVLRCHNQVYDLNEHPYASLSALRLDHEISSCEFSVAKHPRMKPTIVTGFTIKPSEAADADGALELHFRLKFNTYGKELNALLNAVKSNPFDMAIEGLQGGLFDQPDQKADGVAGGTRVDMSGGEGHADEPDAEDDSDQEPPPPIVQALMQGEKFEDAEREASAGTLASRLEIAGGTTASLPARRRRARTFDDSVLPVEEQQPVN